MKLATRNELDEIMELSLRVNDFLTGLFTVLASGLLTSSLSLVGCRLKQAHRLFWQMSLALIIAVYGTARLMRSWTKTGSDTI